MTLLQSDAVRKQIALAAPKHMSPDRMLRVALTTVMRTPKLQQCDQRSLLSALMLCTQAGLEPDGRMAHLIPYGDQVQVIFDYKGLVYLAGLNGVKNIRAYSICENDQFEFAIRNGQTTIDHVIEWKEPRGEVKAYYSTCERDGQCDVEVMTVEEIAAIRQRSKAANSGPWVTDPGEMSKKTVLRRHSKRWPLMAEVAEVFNADDDVPADKFTPKPPEFASRPAKAPSMDFLEQAKPEPEPEPGPPVGQDDPKTLVEAGLAPVDDPMPEHEAFEAWMHNNGILYSQLVEAVAKEDLYPDPESYGSLRDLPVSVIKRLTRLKEGIRNAVKGAK